jgi:hypothetical protein
MLPGEAPPGRGPGRGPPAPGPGRGPPGPAAGRGAGRSTGCCDENGLLPTRGARGAGLGPGRGPGRASGRASAGPAGAVGVADAAGAAGVGAGAGPGRGPGRCAGCASAGAEAAGAAGGGVTGAAGAGFGPGRGPGTGAAPDDAAGLAAGLAGLPPPNDSRSRRATGASTVDDADLTNSPCSLSRASTSLLVTPSSLANSCTRALPATTSPRLEATAVEGPRLGFSYDAWSSGLHGVLMFFATCSLARGGRVSESLRRTRPPRKSPVNR